jgi:hypothetical protein
VTRALRKATLSCKLYSMDEIPGQNTTSERVVDAVVGFPLSPVKRVVSLTISTNDEELR